MKRRQFEEKLSNHAYLLTASARDGISRLAGFSTKNGKLLALCEQNAIITHDASSLVVHLTPYFIGALSSRFLSADESYVLFPTTTKA